MGVFKIEPIVIPKRNKVGYQNRFFRILKDTKEKWYFYGFYDFVFQEYRQLHKGIKLPITGSFITVWCVIFNLLWIPFRLMTFIPIMYFDGAKNFILDGVWYQNVRFFNWSNIVIIIILILLKLLS